MLDLRILKRISAKNKLLAYLYVSYLWIPLRNRMKMDRQLRMFGVSRRSSKSDEMRENEIGSDETDLCLPKLPRLAVIYYFVSTGTHFILLLHSIMLKWRSMSDDQITDDIITCYMPRVHLHEALKQKYTIWFCLVFSSIHLIVRSYVLVHARKFRLDAVTFVLMGDNDSNQNWLTAPPSLIQSNAIGHFSESLMFSRINLTRRRRVGLRLRPSRTPQAREELTRVINTSFTLSIISLWTLAFIVGPITICQILINQESIYEGCIISYYDTVYWFRTVSSVFVCLVWYIDTYLLFAFSVALTSVLVFDSVHYWSDIEEKMMHLKRCMERSPHVEPSWMTEQQQLALEGDQELIGRASIVNMEQDFYEVRSLIGDFFTDLTRANGAVSLALSASFLIWFLSNGMTTLFGLQLKGSTNIAIRLWQLFSFSIISAISHMILHLKRRTGPSYTTICSLMALDRSKRKKEWIGIIRHYMDKRSLYAFTFPGLGVFDELMFFKIMSYILSLTLFVERYEIYAE